MTREKLLARSAEKKRPKSSSIFSNKMSCSQNFITADENKPKGEGKSSNSVNKLRLIKKVLRSTKPFRSTKSKKGAKEALAQTKKISSFLMANRTELLRQTVQGKR